MKVSAHLLLFLISVAPAVSGQTSFSGTSHCGKPDPAHSVEVGDRPDHVYSIVRVHCDWVKPLRMGDAQMTEDQLTGFSEITGNAGADHGNVVGSLSNGDKVYVRTQGKSVLAAGKPLSSAGTWYYVGGTGKLKGIKGKGTYKCKSSDDGTSTCDIKGVRRVPR